MGRYTIFSDGASRGNPGEAGIGIVIYNENQEKVMEVAEYIGIETNNVAEYTALIRGLEEASKLGVTEVEVFADSELMVKQMKGVYKVKNPGLQTLFQQAKKLTQNFNLFEITHVRREKNKEADKLANLGIDNKGAIKAKETNEPTTVAFKMPSLLATEGEADFLKETEIVSKGNTVALKRGKLNAGEEIKVFNTKEIILYVEKGSLEVIGFTVEQVKQDNGIVLNKDQEYILKAIENAQILQFSILPKIAFEL